MKKGIFTLVNSEELLPGYRRLTLAGDTGPLRPGQFAEVSVPGYFLRRPFSVANNGEGWLSIAVREAGVHHGARAAHGHAVQAGAVRLADGDDGGGVQDGEGRVSAKERLDRPCIRHVAVDDLGRAVAEYPADFAFAAGEPDDARALPL